MKKVLSLIICIFLLALTGCQNNSENTDKVNAENFITDYLQNVSLKKADEAFAMIDPSNLPPKSDYSNSIMNANISNIKILKSVKNKDNSFVVTMSYTDDGKTFNVPFSTKINDDRWVVILQTDPTKGQIVDPVN